MERERPFQPDRFRSPGDGAANTGQLDALRNELDELLQTADEALDSISYLQAQAYLQQNQQTGGE